MELWLTLAIGVLFATGLPGATPQLAESSDRLRVDFAWHNLLLLTTGKLKRGAVPILVEGIRAVCRPPATGTDLDGDRHQFCRDCLHAGSCIPNLSVAGHR